MIVEGERWTQHDYRSDCGRSSDGGMRSRDSVSCYTRYIVDSVLQEEQNTAYMNPDNILWAALAFNSYDFITDNGWRPAL